MELLNTWRGDTHIAFTRALIGWGGIIVRDDSIDLLDMLRAYMEKAASESCGQCFPCRSGLQRIVTRLTHICQGKTCSDDIKYLTDLAQHVRKSARCDIGHTSPVPLLDILEKAPHIFEARTVHCCTQDTYTSFVTAPCINACPASVNIPDYIEKIRWGQWKEGLESVMDRCPMPGTIGRVCVRPCETACVRGRNAQPIAIRHLKRFLFDQHKPQETIYKSLAAQKHEQKIAVIGAGPAGLACAYYLLQRGFAVTIFERQEWAGGMARYGIPDYRLPPAVLEQEIAHIQNLGCEIRYGIDIGKDITVQDLEKQGYAIVFVGTGAPNTPSMRVEGEDLCHKGYVSGVHYLSEAAKGRQMLQGKSLVVVGGGNVAMDCVRTALRHGFTDVRILYRRTEQEMPADKCEIHEAKEEGVIFNFLTAPLSLVHTNGCVSGIVCQKMCLGEPDASGRCRPVAIDGETVTYMCDAVVHAIGQKTDIVSTLTGLDGFEKALNSYKDLDAHPVSCHVAAFPHMFGGGDCVTGPNTLIAALAAGRRAARHIEASLQDTKITPLSEETWQHSLASTDVCSATEALPPQNVTSAMPIHCLPLQQRLNFNEVEHASTPAEAKREAGRCLRCFRIGMFITEHAV